MHTNSYRDYPYVSPTCSSKVQNRENQHASTNSYYDDKMKESTSTVQNTAHINSDNLYVTKLQSKILQMQKKIDQQRYQTQLLTRETQQFMNICEQQKKQLNNMNIQMLKQEYNEQITELIQEKHKITQLIHNLSQEYKSAQDEHEDQLQIMKTRNIQLARLIQQGLNQKEWLLNEISSSDKQHLNNQSVIAQQQERIDQLRNIQRKLIIALKQIQALQRKG